MHVHQNARLPPPSQRLILRSICAGPQLARLPCLRNACCDESPWIDGPAKVFPNLPQRCCRPSRKVLVDLFESDHDGRMILQKWMYRFLLPSRDGRHCLQSTLSSRIRNSYAQFSPCKPTFQPLLVGPRDNKELLS